MKSSRFLKILAVLLATTAPMLMAGEKPDSPSAIVVLLGLDSVRQSLNLSPLQCSLLDDLKTGYKKRAKESMEIGMADQDAALRAEWDVRSLRKQYNAQALDVLSPSQQVQFRQIERQLMGGSLLTSLSEQKLLGISSDQQQALSRASQSTQAKASAILQQFNSGKISSFSRDIQLRRNQQSGSNAMIAILTPKQKKDWLVLSGEKSGIPKIHDPDASSKSLFEGY